VAALAALAVAVQLYGLYRPSGPPTPPWFPYADKLEHAVGFALPVALVLLAWGLRDRSRGGRPGRRGWVLVLAVAVAHAVVSEIVQATFYTYRSGDPLDVLADVAGTAVGALAARAVLRRPGPRSGVLAPAGRTRPTGR
jgi:VanZ family protein